MAPKTVAKGSPTVEGTRDVAAKGGSGGRCSRKWATRRWRIRWLAHGSGIISVSPRRQMAHRRMRRLTDVSPLAIQGESSGLRKRPMYGRAEAESRCEHVKLES